MKSKAMFYEHVISPYYWTTPGLYWNQDKERTLLLVPFSFGEKTVKERRNKR